MNWKKKLTSRKFWMAIAALVVGIITLTKPGTDTTQITGLILSLGSVIAYIVGEGLVDAASAGASINIDNATVSGITAGQAATTPDNEPVVDKAGPEATKGMPTGAAQSAEGKQNTALSGQSNSDQA